MTDFYRSDTYLIVKAMKATGNQTGIVEQWRRAADMWAQANVGPDAEALRAWLPLWSVRPFYSVGELAPLFPALAMLLGARERPGPVKSANRLANELTFAGLHPIDYGRPFRNPATGQHERFFPVERVHFWTGREVSDEEFLEAYHAQS